MNNSSAGFLLRAIKVIIVITVIAMVAWAVFWAANKFIIKRATLSMGGQVFQAEVADTDELRQRGLSQHSMIDSNSSMLFVFDRSDYHQIWMKDMRFPIDAIWLNEDKKIVHIERWMQPDDSPHKTYSPTVPAKYIIEMAAGKTDELKLKIGSSVEFDFGGQS